MYFGFLSVALLFVVTGIAATVALTVWAERRFPAEGRFVPVTGGRLHVLDRRPVDVAGPTPIVLLHGASGNARDMMTALGDKVGVLRHVFAFDRPGHGWSDRPGGRSDAAPQRQAALIREALAAMGVTRAVFVGHSWSGALATRFALDHPSLVAGLVLLAPVTHPWPGGVTWYYTPASHPLVAPVFAHAISAPVGALHLSGSITGVFAPDPAPADYAGMTGTWLVLRPSEFRANAQDVKDLHAHVVAQAHRYGEIVVPTTIIHGEADTTVSPRIHADALAREIPGARLILLPGAGHMPHHAYRDLVADEIERVALMADAGAGARAG